MINRYSSRKNSLKQEFLLKKLYNAKSYDRIAGYFSSSILEIAKEEFETIDKIRIVCNSGVNIHDVRISKIVDLNETIRQEWNVNYEKLYSQINNNPIFETFYNYLKSKKIEIRLIKDDLCGLMHGKAGVITLRSGEKTSFLGSANETFQGWSKNYELIWEDNSIESIKWVQEEFEFLWSNGIPLSNFMIEEIGRIQKEKKIDINKWKKDRDDNNIPNPVSLFVNTPIYRNESGIWEHQKEFIQLAFKEHLTSPSGARFILADMVGLGKTISMGGFAKAVALYSNEPVLILAPKTLIEQWQTELMNLLETPSAIWKNNSWITEEGQILSREQILNCPRKIGIVSHGLISSNSRYAKELKKQRFACILVDEAHKSRRGLKYINNVKNKEQHPENYDCTNLFSFLFDISPITKSMVFGTATPIQLAPIELWDLLYILGNGNNLVLGDKSSLWRKFPLTALNIISNNSEIYGTDKLLEWFSNPLLPNDEDKFFYSKTRMKLQMNENDYIIPHDKLSYLSTDRFLHSLWIEIKDKLTFDYLNNHNPFSFRVVRRTRDTLVKEGKLKYIDVKLEDSDLIYLNSKLEEAYNYCAKFCHSLGERKKNSSGFLKTLLLRRIGSSLNAGLITVENMLNGWDSIENIYDLDDLNDIDEATLKEIQKEKSLTEQEKEYLNYVRNILVMYKNEDPKYEKLKEYLRDRKWIEKGCIVFSQYYDTIDWFFNKLKIDLKGETIGVYAGANKSKIYKDGKVVKCSRDEIKNMVRKGEIRLLLGTDSASEGLNLQTLGSLINIDLPYNPTRLEQRKGRIQRIGQINDTIYIYNMRYKNSVEDRVHELLSERLEKIKDIFGDIPDSIEDVWIHVALGEKEKLEEDLSNIDNIKNKFSIKDRGINTEKILNWENVEIVIDNKEMLDYLSNGWI